MDEAPGRCRFAIDLIQRLRDHTTRQPLPVIVMSADAGLDEVGDLLRSQALDASRSATPAC